MGRRRGKCKRLNIVSNKLDKLKLVQRLVHETLAEKLAFCVCGDSPATGWPQGKQEAGNGGGGLARRSPCGTDVGLPAGVTMGRRRGKWKM